MDSYIFVRWNMDSAIKTSACYVGDDGSSFTSKACDGYDEYGIDVNFLGKDFAFVDAPPCDVSHPRFPREIAINLLVRNCSKPWTC